MQLEWPLIDAKNDSHVLVVSDPQLIDRNCYSVFVTSRAWISDLFMSRAFSKLMRHSKPDSVVFLGDLLDGGREWEDVEYNIEMNRFHWIFGHKKSGNDRIFHPGNHDIGIGNTLVVKAAERFKATYDTELNLTRTIQNVTFVSINSLGLVEIDQNPLGNETVEFIEKFQSPSNNTIILLSHIPLYRPDNTYCGPLRSLFARKTINQYRGHQYQNLLAQSTSEWLIEKLKPSLILSGDDHDICHYSHSGIPEETVATFNCLQGTLFPGYLMLTINGSNFKYSHGYLPSAILAIYIYLMLGFIVVLIRVYQLMRAHNYLPLPFTSNRTGFHQQSVIIEVVTPLIMYLVIFFISFNF